MPNVDLMLSVAIRHIPEDVYEDINQLSEPFYDRNINYVPKYRAIFDNCSVVRAGEGYLIVLPGADDSIPAEILLIPGLGDLYGMARMLHCDWIYLSAYAPPSDTLAQWEW